VKKITTLNAFTVDCLKRIQDIYAVYLHDIPAQQLQEAIRDNLFNLGKGIRPLLIYSCGAIFAVPLERLDIAAAAIESMHTYSLIHDDLPCMDNADLRRGQAACHKKFGEDIAVLTGDALQTLAFHILVSHPASLSSHKRLQMLDVLCQAAGPYGMAAGQALDLACLQGQELSLESLLHIYQLKTGALLSACVQLAYIASDDSDSAHRQAIFSFGEAIGLAFQIQDDILDISTESAVSGKTAGIDQHNNKLTYPQQVGLEAARLKVQDLYQDALKHLACFGEQAQTLRELCRSMLERKK
jgi:farnesyl diphosphate synthase